jgi:hypothetical protein
MNGNKIVSSNSLVFCFLGIAKTPNVIDSRIRKNSLLLVLLQSLTLAILSSKIPLCPS